MNFIKIINTITEQFTLEEMERMVELSDFLMAEMLTKYPVQSQEYLDLTNKLKMVAEGQTENITEELKNYFLKTHLFSPNQN